MNPANNLVTVDVLSLVKETYLNKANGLAQVKAMYGQKRDILLKSVDEIGRSLLATNAIAAFHAKFVCDTSLAIDVAVRYHATTGEYDPVSIRLLPPEDADGKQLNIAAKYHQLTRRQAELTKELTALQAECTHPNPNEKRGSSTGNWDRSDDCSWIDYHCPDCGKRWREEN